MEMEFLSALQYRTYVHHLQFYSWIKQCNQWLHPIVQKPLRKKKRVHPWHYYYYPAASSVATAAAATAMNVNNFIPKGF
jgi:hypothetical protein